MVFPIPSRSPGRRPFDRTPARRRLARPRSETRGSARSRHRAVCSRPRRDRITVARPDPSPPRGRRRVPVPRIRRRSSARRGRLFRVRCSDRCDGITDVSNVFPEYAQIPGTRFGVGLARTRVRFVGTTSSHGVITACTPSIASAPARIDVADITVRDFASDHFSFGELREAIAVIGCVTGLPGDDLPSIVFLDVLGQMLALVPGFPVVRSHLLSPETRPLPWPPPPPDRRRVYRSVPVSLPGCSFLIGPPHGAGRGELIAAAFPPSAATVFSPFIRSAASRTASTIFFVTGTPAEVVRQRFPHFRLGRIRVRLSVALSNA